MNLAELRQAVYEITGRPDMVTATLTAIQEATLAAHLIGYFARDLKEVPIATSSTDFMHSLAIRTAIPRLRDPIKYIRNFADGVPGDMLNKISPLSPKDLYGWERVNVWYQAGDSIQTKVAVATNSYLVGGYQLPNVTESGYTSWIAEDFPSYIYHTAAARICTLIGFAEQAQQEIAAAKEIEARLMQLDI